MDGRRQGSKKNPPATNFVSYPSKGFRLSELGSKSERRSLRRENQVWLTEKSLRKCNFYNQTVKLAPATSKIASGCEISTRKVYVT